jgi:hypothetical protein
MGAFNDEPDPCLVFIGQAKEPIALNEISVRKLGGIFVKIVNEPHAIAFLVNVNVKRSGRNHGKKKIAVEQTLNPVEAGTLTESTDGLTELMSSVKAETRDEVSRKGWFAKLLNFVKAKTQGEANQTEIVLKLVFLAHGLHRLATP